MLLLSELPVERNFSQGGGSPGEAVKKHGRRNLEEFTPTHLQEIPRSIVTPKVSKNPSQRQGHICGRLILKQK